ncbi:hypothetical protein [Paenibacillus mendelii]|uniref:Zinc-finger domain-containing protein n=1 Tax=Paenibacillus mendelii TaxID=206163 RepID=A0ABV6J3T9_9BACL|nr:hypothetical protein [Paenibacillus mendelii]MCQ6561880.1 hypothetical protein [Paenibacillus mendelii]
MKHPAGSMWKAFADDMLSDQDREWAYDHLAECDECLAVYIELMARLDTAEALTPQQADVLTDQVMEWVSELPPLESQASSKESGSTRRIARSGSNRRQTALHYVIAVCCMLLLISTGVFDRLANQPNQWRAEREEPERASLTTAIMEKTTSVIGALVEKPMSHHNPGKEH